MPKPGASIIENVHFAIGLVPAADNYIGTKDTDVVNMGNYGRCTFVIFNGAGTTGVSTVTVQAADNVTPDNRTAIAFNFKVITTNDVQGATTLATTAGFSTTAGSDDIYVIEVTSGQVQDAGFDFVHLRLVETTDAAVLGGIMVMLTEPRHAQDQTISAIT